MNHALKLKFYYEHVLGTVYAEGDSPMHKSLTADVITRFIDPEKIPLDARIIDLGCGPGYFLDEMKSRGYTNMLGLTLSPEDVNLVASKGHQVEKRDVNFLKELDESVDFLFCRHSLEHSPFPYITLLEYNRVLKSNGLLYVEVPAPDCEIKHEENQNHFSVLGRTMWLSLLERTGFDISWHECGYDVKFLDERGKKHENYYMFVCRRRRPMDIK